MCSICDDINMEELMYIKVSHVNMRNERHECEQIEH